MKQNKTKFITQLTIIVVLALSVMVQPITANAATTLDLEAESAILVDYDTGKILYAKDEDKALNPASMVKMMTEYLVLEAIEEGVISENTTTEISEYAYSISANNNYSGIGLRLDYEYSVSELYEAMAIYSDNATTIALAELVGGTEGGFVQMMNEKAEEMGLPKAKFVNSTGLKNNNDGVIPPEGTGPNDVNLLSAESAALLAYHLVKDFPQALDISSKPTLEFEGHTLSNWNSMVDSTSNLHYYEGIDGLKTGNTGDERGHMFTGTAEQNGKRLISVVMNLPRSAGLADDGRTLPQPRFADTATLMDYGFNKFELKELFSEGYQLEEESTLPVAKGKEDHVDVSISKGFSVPVEIGNEDLYSVKYHINEELLNEEGEIEAPIEKGQVVGTAELVYAGDNNYGYITQEGSNTVDLVTNSGVEKANWFMLTLGAIGDFFSGIFDTIVGWFS